MVTISVNTVQKRLRNQHFGVEIVLVLKVWGYLLPVLVVGSACLLVFCKVGWMYIRQCQ